MTSADAEREELLALLLAEELARADDLERIPRRNEPGPAPLSFSQQRLWFIDQLEGSTAAYNEPRTVLLDGPLDVAKLEAAFTALVARHDTLRSAFPSTGGIAHQQVRAPWPVSLPIEDLSSEPDPLEALRTRVDEDLARPFDLARSPLWRASLVRLGPRRHALLRTQHHTITDGWSVEVFNRELFTLYAAACAGQPDPLPPLPIQYGDYATWQRRLFGPEQAWADLDFWREALADLPVDPVLECDRPRGGQRRFEGGTHGFRFGPELTAALHAFARSEGVTLYAVLLTAFGTLLGRLGDRRDVPIGTPVANRTRAELEGLVGLFVNTLVMRVRMEGAPSFRELLQHVSAMSIAAFAHQELPFEHVVDAVAPTRDLSRSALFQTMFVLHKPALERFEVAGLQVSRIEPRRVPARFDLTLVIEQTEGALKCRFDYAERLFEPATIAAFAEQFDVLVRAALARPQTSIDELPLLGEAAWARLESWTGTGTPSAGPLVHERVAATAARDPDRLALVGAGRTLSYRELDEAANGLAWRLHELEPGRGAVAVLAERSPDTVVAMLAAFKLGRPFVPIDPREPDDRLRRLMQLAGAELLVGDRPGFRTVSEAPARRDPPPADVALHDIAYVIFTSGSTGTPKGVQVEHLQLCSYIDGVLQRFAIEPGRHHAVVSSLAADLGHTSTFGSLCTGGTLHVLSREEATDPAAFARRMRDIDYLKIVPSHLAALLGDDPRVSLPRRGLVIGGEAASVDWLRDRVLPFASCRIDNHYGPTEATVGVLTFRIEQPPPRIPLGRPLPGARVHVLDANLRPCGIGGIGEICISGPQVARGYLGTTMSSAFVRDPNNDSRMYKTGDRGRRRSDGCIEFLGRFDDQAKISGHRVEPGEVRAMLVTHPAVRDAAVIVRPGPDGAPRLLAYAVAPGSTRDELIEHLERQLPPPLVPRAVLLLDRLPLTQNGKLDRRALPEPELDDTRSARGQARTELEARLLAAWSEILGRPIAVTDNFFASGGDSFATLRLVARLQREGLQISAREVFRHQTVRALAAALRVDVGSAPRPRPRTNHEPLSPRQARILAAGEREGERAAWNRLLALEHIHGPLDVDRLAAALDECVARHEILRTSFSTHEQHVHPHARVPWVRGRVRASAESVLDRIAGPLAELLDTPMRLDTPPLLRAGLFTLADDEHVLALIGHDLVTDVTSAGILWYELCRLYAGEQLPTPALHFLDAVHWRAEQDLPGLERWRAMFSPPPQRLPLPGVDSSPHSFAGHRVRFEIPPSLGEALAVRAEQLGVTRYACLHAALAGMLADWTGSRDVVIGVPFTGRVHPALEGVMGPLINPLPIRTRVGSDFDELARATSSELHRAVVEELPFETLMRELGISVVQVLLTFAANAREREQLPGCPSTPLFPTAYSARYDLTVAIWETAEGTLSGFVAGPKRRFSLDDLRAAANRFLATLRATCHGVQQTVARGT
jgi:amino acid adenylation domain-containing protein